MNLFFRLKSYLVHLITAGDEHSVHSPFVFTLYTKCIRTTKQFYAFDKIEAIRRKLITDQRKINIEDYGAGSSITKSPNRQISEIAKYSSKSPKIAQILFRISWHLKPKTTLELGTNLGLTTAYLSAADSNSNIYSIEGCPNLSEIAKKNLQDLAINNSNVLTGKIEDILPDLLVQLQNIDCCFIDANHTYKATIQYFKTILSYTNNESLIIFDDIYWSKEMNKAWKEIIAHPEVTLSVDLYHIGLIFFRTNAPKQHFKLKI